jgi:hypothetical protein
MLAGMTNVPKQDFPRYLKLRRMHDSLYVTIPREYVNAHDLSAHDEVLWDPNGNGVLLKFDRVHGHASSQDEEAA